MVIFWSFQNAINATLSVGAADLGSNTLVATYLGTTPAGSYASIGGTASGINILNTSSASIPSVNQYAYFAVGTSIIAVPTISSVSSCVPLTPANSFYAMDTLTINGTGFIATGGVSVGGQPATILDASSSNGHLCFRASKGTVRLS